MEDACSKKSIFSTLIFPEVLLDGEIETTKFLLAADNLVLLFDTLGAWLKLVKADVQGNIKKIRDRYDKDPANSQYLSAIVQSEIDAKVHNRDPCATLGVLWLHRGMCFLYEFLLELLDDFRNNVNAESLMDAARSAYGKVLAKHHNWLMQKTFHFISYAAPKRSSVVHNITCNGTIPVEQTMAELNGFMISLKPNLDGIDKMLISKNIS